MLLHTQKKDPETTRPFIVSAMRTAHGLLVLYAAAIVGVAYLTGEKDAPLTSERIFSFAVSTPIFVGSLLCWLAATVRCLFGSAIFLCVLLALLLGALPLMMKVFFPVHIALFSLAAVYGLSAFILIRYMFSLPSPPRK